MLTYRQSIRTADDDTRRALVEEMLNPMDLDRMLRDSFANYVVQTAMDRSDPETKMHLMDAIRPMLPAIRHTPHGRRISSKISEYDAQMSGLTIGLPSGQLTPSDSMSPGQTSLMGPPASYGRPMSSYTSPNSTGGALYGHGVVSPTPQRSVNGPMFQHAPAQFAGFNPMGRGPQPNGMSHF